MYIVLEYNYSQARQITNEIENKLARQDQKTKHQEREKVNKMTYFEMVKADIENNQDDYQYIVDECDSMDEIRERLYDAMWIDDSITGNASGSYYCNSYRAKQDVMENTETVAEALREFCVDAETIGEKFLNEEWEYLDVTARCYVLGQALEEFLDENEEDIEKYLEERKEA